MNLRTHITVVLIGCLVLSTAAFAQQGKGRGPGGGQGRGRQFRGGRGPGAGPGHGQDERFAEDRDVFHFLLNHHEQIKRTVKELPNGVETVTESDDPEVAAKIKEHVKWMEYRVEEQKPIRRRDPLFEELFRHADKIQLKRTETEHGVQVVETSDDPQVVRLIQAHAKVVSAFVERGFAEATKNHPVPGSGDAKTTDGKVGEFIHPAIKDYGAVVPLPQAKQQPRDGSRIVVDITQGSEPDVLNSAIEKVARFVNIYRGAGAKPAEVKIAVVLHGDATLCVLNSNAYAERFGTKGNPNLECLMDLHHEGVEFYVCGQSLIHKQAKPEDVALLADVAVSGLTALVNLQADGYAYLPLLK